MHENNEASVSGQSMALDSIEKSLKNMHLSYVSDMLVGDIVGEAT